MNSHYLSLSFIIILFFFSTVLPPSYCTVYEPFVRCSRPFGCGSIKNISYPFWGGHRLEYCGRKSFKLECHNDEYTVYRFKELEFRVLNITTSSMTIARLDLWDTPCSRKLLNTTLNYTEFSYASNFHNLTLYYGCSPSLNRSFRHWFSCSSETGNANNGFLVDKETFLSTKPRELENCNTTIKVPISRTALINGSEVVNRALQKALNRGFDVQYNALPIICSGCMESGGKCGSNSTYPFVCHCHDGEQPYWCLRNGMHALSLFTFLY